jgi:hypothetical protein
VTKFVEQMTSVQQAMGPASEFQEE